MSFLLCCCCDGWRLDFWPLPLLTSVRRSIITLSLLDAGARRLGAAPARPISTAGGNNLYRTLYQNIFKSNIAYLTYVFAGAIALEWVYSKGIDTAWAISNRGVRAEGHLLLQCL